MMENMLRRPNIEVKLNTGFQDVDADAFDHIFYTGAVDELMEYCFGPLPYRSERFELETYHRQYYQDAATVNYPNNYDFTRIHEYKHYLNEDSEYTTIAKEYPEPFEIGRNERYYPVFTDEAENLYEKYLALAKEKYPNMDFFGRLGDYKYYDMDKAIARAMEVYSRYVAVNNTRRIGILWTSVRFGDIFVFIFRYALQPISNGVSEFFVSGDTICLLCNLFQFGQHPIRTGVYGFIEPCVCCTDILRSSVTIPICSSDPNHRLYVSIGGVIDHGIHYYARYVPP